MLLFRLPEWIKPHLYSGKKFNELTEREVEDLRIRLSHFKHDDPEVSVVIPAWNEENNIYGALSSLAANKVSHKVEIIVINNNSTDQTQKILDRLEVRNFSQPVQGITHARQMGLLKAKGKYHLCADSDTFYPPEWIELMIKPMAADKSIAGVYGRYSFIPATGQYRPVLFIYEKLTGILIRIRKLNHEFINVLGFNMGFVTATGKSSGGFQVNRARKFDNTPGSRHFVDESEDGTMALNLLKKGRLKLISNPRARVFTSSRRLLAGGGIFKSFLYRAKLHSKRMLEYLSG